MNRILTTKYYKESEILDKFNKLSKTELIECIDDIIDYMKINNNQSKSFYIAKSMGFDYNKDNNLYYRR